jgi:3-isopropylmalate dehydrogenase
MIESTRMLLDWLGHSRGASQAIAAAAAMSKAMDQALADPAARTGDINGRGTTASMTQAIIDGLD